MMVILKAGWNNLQFNNYYKVNQLTPKSPKGDLKTQFLIR